MQSAAAGRSENDEDIIVMFDGISGNAFHYSARITSICGNSSLPTCIYEWMAPDSLRHFQLTYNNLIHDFFAQEETELAKDCGTITFRIPSAEGRKVTQLRGQGVLTLGKCRYNNEEMAGGGPVGNPRGRGPGGKVVMVVGTLKLTCVTVDAASQPGKEGEAGAKNAPADGCSGPDAGRPKKLLSL